MPGPAIRAWHIAEHLANEHEVRLVSTVAASRSHPSFSVEFSRDSHRVEDLARWCDVLVFQGGLLHDHPTLIQSSKVLIADIYDPFHLENLERAGYADDDGRHSNVAHLTEVLNEQLRRGDHFLCASEKQRDFWLGSLAALGRVNPATYDEDPNLRALITVVPFGLPSEAPAAAASPLRSIPGIGPDDPVVLWAGGVYNWFDPLTLLHAVDRLRQRLPAVRLVFLGMQHPNPAIPAMSVAARLRETSDELGLTDVTVFFNETWVPYDERGAWLLGAQVGASTHHEHIETSFSFRTRILDYLWAGLPVVATAGDAFAELIDGEGIGGTAPAGDVEALAAALHKAIVAPPDRQRIREVASRFAWDRSLAPLVELCRNPSRAPDLVRTISLMRTDALPLRQRLSDAYREGGIALIAERTARLAAERLERRRS